MSGVSKDEIRFWKWVISKRVTDNPEGDFIKDTKTLVTVHGKGVVTEEVVKKIAARLWNGSAGAQEEERKLREAFAKTPYPT